MLDVTRRHAPLAFAAILAATRAAAAQGRIVFHRGNDGDPETLCLLYQTGLGDRNSQGFGMFRMLL